MQRHDMTQGGIARTLIAFSLPLMLSGVLQQLYSWADALIVGNVVGEGALAAVGATGSVVHLFLSLVMGFSVGVSILSAQATGQGDPVLVNRLASLFLLLIGGLALAMAGCGGLLTDPILRAMDTPADILADAALYLRIILAGVPFMGIYNVYTAVLRGIGDSRTPMWSIVVSSVGNVALDLLFVAGWGWGVGGAALATVLSQAAMTVYVAVISAKKHPELRVRLSRDIFDRELLARGMRLSLPTAVQSGVLSVGSLMLQNIVNSFGTQTVAAVTTAYRIDTIGLLPAIQLGAGITTFTAQNEGAGNRDRVRRGIKAGVPLSAAAALSTTAVIIFFGRPLLALFGLSDESVAIGYAILIRLAAFYPLFGPMNALTGYLQGIGDVSFASGITTAALAVRIGASYLLTPYLGNRVIAYAEALSWVFQTLACLWRMRRQSVRGET